MIARYLLEFMYRGVYLYVFMSRQLLFSAKKWLNGHTAKKKFAQLISIFSAAAAAAESDILY